MISMPQWAKSSTLRVALPAARRSQRGLVSATDGCDLGIKLRDGGTLASAICGNGSEVSGSFLSKGQNLR